MYKNIEPSNCVPPGTFLANIPHPSGDGNPIEKAVIMEHRFAFFFWMKWHNNLVQKGGNSEPSPTLITIDWHRDLAPPSENLKKELLELDQSDFSDVANFVWARFDQTNDSHIRCATWLNLIGDVVLLKNTGDTMQDSVQDYNGNDHHIYEFRAFNEFQDFMLERDDSSIFFDVDLDYFIHGKGQKNYSEDFRRYSDDEIRQIVDPELPVYQYILPKIDGITLAQEPEYCGGIRNSCHIMNTLHQQLFSDRNEWRHLQI